MDKKHLSHVVLSDSEGPQDPSAAWPQDDKRKTQRDVVIFAGALFDSPLWTNRQQIATRLAERGWRVLYVEPRLFLGAPFLGRLNSREGTWAWIRRHFVPAEPRANLRVLAQSNLVPGSRRHRWVGRLNHIINIGRVRAWSWLLGFQDPAVLLYDTEAARSLSAFPASRIIYDCVDDHRVQAGVNRNPELVEREEKLIARRADAIAVTTEPLRQRFQSINQRVTVVPNAADIQAFLSSSGNEPDDMRTIRHPRVGTVGALDAYKIDVELLATIARKHPEWQFILIGPVEYAGEGGKGTANETVMHLQTFPNVHFLGTKSKEEVPAYMHALDVAMIPYRTSEYNRSSFPLKFWEFMASGKPVVASGLPSLSSYNDHIYLADDAAGFESGIESALKESPEKKVRRQEEAKKHDWSTRVDAIERLLWE